MGLPLNSPVMLVDPTLVMSMKQLLSLVPRLEEQHPTPTRGPLVTAALVRDQTQPMHTPQLVSIPLP